MRRFATAFLLSFSLFSTSCTAVLDDALQPVPRDCEGREDGTPCAGADLCLAGQCVYSSCGDGFVDSSLGESCDDSNLVPGDGCEPGRCRFSCTRDEQCQPSDPCMASGGCDTTTHTCRDSLPTSGGACTLGDSSEGICRTGLCASLLCGNGSLDAGEECDEATAGCRTDCQWVCDAETACSTDDVCEMAVDCNTSTHLCEELGPPNCDDADACTAESCDALEGCRSALIDADGDGFSPMTCSQNSNQLGGDCDDTNPNRYPGAPEMLNELDDDCDGVVDDNPGVTCFRDRDLDGYGNPNETKFATVCDQGWVGSRPRNDCHDENPSVNPGVTSASPTPYCRTGTLQGTATTGYRCSDNTEPRWDWNCDGMDTHEVQNVLQAACSTLATCGGSYWADAVPPCGQSGKLRSCANNCSLGILCSCKTVDSPSVVARCL